MLDEDSGLIVEGWVGFGSELSQMFKSLKTGGGWEMVKKGEETKML